MERACGIDISFWESTVGWDLLAPSIDFAYIKVSQDNFKDSLYYTHWNNAKNFGVTRGGYHFWRGNPNFGGIKQAELMVKTMGTDLGELPLMFDFEDSLNKYAMSNAWQSEQGKIFCERVTALVGKKPIIYTGGWYIGAFGHLVDWMKDYEGWLAQYPWENRKDFIQNYSYFEHQAITTELAPVILAPTTVEPSLRGTPWSNWSLWQFTGHGRKPGLNGDVDIEVYNGTVEEFRAHFGLVPPTPAPLSWEQQIDSWARTVNPPYTGDKPNA